MRTPQQIKAATDLIVAERNHSLAHRKLERAERALERATLDTDKTRRGLDLARAEVRAADVDAANRTTH